MNDKLAEELEAYKKELKAYMKRFIKNLTRKVKHG